MTVTPDEHQEQDRHPRARGAGSLQRRFEDSSLGKAVISVGMALFVTVGVVCNLPDSPIKRELLPVVEPVAVPAALDQSWAMYANPSRRQDSVDVQVRFADGQTRVWNFEPGAEGVGWWDRWLLLRYAAVLNPDFRRQLAHWVVARLSQPDDEPVSVAMLLHTETLTAPGEEEGETRRPTASKLLYQENLTGSR
ncbi:hypothetical protein [Mycobacterium sp. 852002-51961_SCH5331710]|uniref:hypothetical protein n=1 Tax=Mycobacterium sp. 852002-51961_SCH5331710 TaxID=1834105 RepID=UPI0007FC112F|nr:hypothetical protein [Mycobacterium sp. 852002-51961_SCH5331710]OBB39912.1 hypothetical protein A5752_09965 [Mycobacterium sp. 852002-51961_SCH5331710]